MSVVTTTHPLLGCVSDLRAGIASVAEFQPIFMSTSEKQTALVELARLEAQTSELRLRILAASSEIGEETGARDAAAWLAHMTRADSAATRADARIAARLERRPVIAAAMRRGQLSPAQALVITAALEDLPAHLGPQIATDAETTLVALAADFGPSDLRRLARRLLDVVAPEIAETEQAKRLEAEERRARAKAFLKFLNRGDGTTELRGLLPTTTAQRLKRYLQAYTSPRAAASPDADNADAEGSHATGASPGEATGNGERIPQHRAYAHAFTALLELLDPHQLPEHGGDATTVIITMTIDQLRTDLATAEILTTDHTVTDSGDGETTLSAEHARRLACQAGIIPTVLGTQGQPLDIGRTARLHRPHQRKAIRLRDQRCRAEGCTIPAAWTEIHHKTPWAHGGRTTVDDGTCLCSHHHHLIHDRGYDHTWLPSGDVRFHRRQ